MTKILVVDDNKEIIEILLPHLIKEKFIPVIAYDGEMALELFEEHDIDLVLLDVMMPNLDGLSVCKKIRKDSKVPIIMITARTSEEDIIHGLDIGADDYIIKPFSPKQVVAKIKALLRRLDDYDDKVINVDNLVVDIDKYIVKIDNKTFDLSKKEIEILYLFVSKPEHVFTREYLLEEVWGYDYEGDYRNIDTHIKRIRAKLKIKENNYKWDIKTVWGVGYKFEIN